MDAVAIAMALPIDKLRSHGGLHCNSHASTTWQGATNNSIITSFNICHMFGRLRLSENPAGLVYGKLVNVVFSASCVEK